MTSMPTVTLNNGVEMPQLGFGVFQVPDDETTAAVTAALAAGYRSIDTAAIYGNEEGTGRALAESGIPREDLFITSKLWIEDLGYEPTLAAFESSLDKLGLDYLDLYLIHWPAPESDKYADSWLALEKLLADGRVRAIGVSNFLPEHVQRLVDLGGTVPAVNQVELHPALQQRDVAVFNRAHGIATGPGVRWRRAWCWTIRPSSTLRPVTAARRPRLCCVGTCSRGGLSFPNR